ncbi:MAG: response regulator transcription factor [Candidatus Omnitrophica bacterium]|nr:response regulator transcription factor [Candidatus Omnitrophota bacterium]
MTSKASVVLVVDDEPGIQSLLNDILTFQKYRAISAFNLAEARETLTKTIPDLILLDRVLPDGDGLELCHELRNQDRTKLIPILFLSSKQEIEDKVLGLKLGGDDYLPKPFATNELVARIEALLRRRQDVSKPDTALPSVLKFETLELDLPKHECRIDGQVMNLRPKEFALLKLFLEEKGKTFTKEDLGKAVWKKRGSSQSRAIDSAIQRLRKELGPYGMNIETVHGYGFRFQEKPSG